MKKRIISLLLIASMCIPLPVWAEESSGDTAAEKISFSDVTETHYAYDAVMSLAEQGIISGRSENEFAPEESLMREEFSKILVNAFELTDDKDAPIFTDVLARTWYADYVAKVAVSGLMQGVSENVFGVGYKLSRQDLAVILKRFLDNDNIVLSAESSVVYADNDEIASYAREAVEILSASGIMQGKENNLWRPSDAVTRADAAIAIYNAIKARREYIASLGKMGPISQYDLPHEMSFNDRLSEATPTVFDPNTMPKRELVLEDFNDSSFGKLTRRGWGSANVTVVENEGVDGSGCLKVTGDASDIFYPTLDYKAQIGELKAGDFLAFTLKIRAENVSGDGGLFCGKVSVYDDNDTWLAESWGNNRKSDIQEWREFTWIQVIPEELNDLNPPDFYKVGLGAYVKNIDGTFWFDDFRLDVIITDPMETVLMTPNYKGIIKGDDGIGDITLRAFVDDKNGAYDLSKFKMTSQITDEEHKVYIKTECDTITRVMDICFSSSSLPMGGDFQLETILTDKESGEVVQKNEWPLHKREKDFTTKIDYDKYGRIIQNGEPVFPISVYNSTSYADAVPDFIDSGVIDAMMHSGMAWYLNWGTSESYRRRINQLGENGLGMSLALGGIYMETATKEIKERMNNQEDLRAYLTKVVRNFRDLPNLFGYYAYDEVSAARYGNELAWARKIIESEDLDHPTICAIDNPQPTSPGMVAKTSDFLGFDPYPVTGRESQDISLVYDRLTEAKEICPNRPIYAILQGFYYGKRGDLRAPTKNEFRNMAFQAICAGACMLDMYSYRYLQTAPDPNTPWRELWDSYTGVFKEVQHFEPIILSVLPTPYYEVKGGGEWLNTMSRRYDGKSYLFAVNNENEGKSALIYLDGVKKIKGMYTGKVYEANSDGWFEIDFENYEVEVFEYEQADYKSSHAELDRFGLSECIIAENQGEQTIIVHGGKTEVEYSAAISDCAKFFINGTEMAATGKIDISGLAELAITVISEDGRFKTTKTYRIEADKE